MDAVVVSFPLLVGLIVIALLFDFLNGLHDAANSIATIVSTRVLSPRYAVLWAAFFNFIAFLFFGLHVAETIGKGIVEASVIDARVVFGALMGAIVWNVVTWIGGIPSSSLARARRRPARRRHRQGRQPRASSGRACSRPPPASCCRRWSASRSAIVLVVIVTWTFAPHVAHGVDRYFRIFQFLSAALYSLGHGGNDAQKTMGIIAVLLYSQGYLSGAFHVPLWVILAAQSAMGLGTLFGGWRIVKTMGSKITRLTPMQGFCAETGGAITLFLRDRARRAGLDDAHHHRGDHRRRRGAARLRRALGRRPRHRRRLDRHHPGLGADRGAVLRPRAPLRLAA